MRRKPKVPAEDKIKAVENYFNTGLRSIMVIEYLNLIT